MSQANINLEQVAGRIRSARGFVRMTRKEFCEKHGFNLHTVFSWEAGKYLVRKPSLERFCKALASEGVICATEWLMEGKGDGPTLIAAQKNIVSPKAKSKPANRVSDSQEEQRIHAEIKAFQGGYKKAKMDAVVIQVADIAMSPLFEVGDYVGGCRVKSEDGIKALLGKICIVEIGLQNFVVRRLGREGKRIALVAGDPTEQILTFDRIVSAAEIIWHRRMAK
jgi:SOS-response transcriptional repressor LexA